MSDAPEMTPEERERIRAARAERKARIRAAMRAAGVLLADGDGRPYLTPVDVSGYTVLRLDDATRRRIAAEASGHAGSDMEAQWNN